MNIKLVKISQALFLLAAGVCIFSSEITWAETPSQENYASINLSNFEQSEPIIINITEEIAKINKFSPDEKLELSVAVKSFRSGKWHYISDSAGQKTWEIKLDETAQASLVIKPRRPVFTGRVIIFSGDKVIFGLPQIILEKVRQYEFIDGASLKLHFTDQINELGQAMPEFDQAVLHAAISGYKEIVFKHGFGSPNYTFSQPDYLYAYDRDKTIDIYIGDKLQGNALYFHGFSGADFAAAPFAEFLKQGGTEYKAVILIPADYRNYLKEWGVINGQDKFRDKIIADLNGTIAHEILHIITYSYNRNLESCRLGSRKGKLHHGNWYVEGLARYFEYLAGYQTSYFSYGFRTKQGNFTSVYPGGVNYLLRYPDRPLEKFKYDFALFWSYIHKNYGMKKVEILSQDFRNIKAESLNNRQIMSLIAKTLGVKIDKLVENFAFYIYQAHEQDKRCERPACCRVTYDGRNFWIKDHQDKFINLGSGYRTDRVLRWGNLTVSSADDIIAGDASETADIFNFGCDFHQISLSQDARNYFDLKISNLGPGGNLKALVGYVLRGEDKSNRANFFSLNVGKANQSKVANLSNYLKDRKIDLTKLESIVIMLFNLGEEQTSYKITGLPILPKMAIQK